MSIITNFDINFNNITLSSSESDSEREYDMGGVGESKEGDDESMSDHEQDRKMNDEPSSSSEDELDEDECEVELILDLRYSVYRGRINTEYLVQYTGHEDRPEWTFADDCECHEAIADFLAKRKEHSVWIICRTSVKNDTTESSLLTQETLLRKKAKELYPDYNVCAVIIDGKTAYNSVPPEFKIIKRETLDGDVIFVSRVDRFGRRIKEFSDILNELKNRNIDVYSVSEDCSYTRNNVHFLRLLGDAQLESENQGARRKLGRDRKRAAGHTYLGGPIPFGKRKLVENGLSKLVDNEEEQNIVQFILTNDRNNKQTAIYLNEMNNLRRGKPWTTISVSKIRFLANKMIVE